MKRVFAMEGCSPLFEFETMIGLEPDLSCVRGHEMNSEDGEVPGQLDGIGQHRRHPIYVECQ